MCGYIVYVDSGVIGGTFRKTYTESEKGAGFARGAAAYVRADGGRVFVNLPLVEGGNVDLRLSEVVGVECDDSVKGKCAVLISGGARVFVAEPADRVREFIKAGYGILDARLRDELKASEKNKNDLETEVEKRIQSVVMTACDALLKQEEALLVLRKSLMKHLLSQMASSNSSPHSQG